MRFKALNPFQVLGGFGFNVKIALVGKFCISRQIVHSSDSET